jgi:hypothetical protein
MPHKIERLCSVTSDIVATNSGSTSPKIPFGAASGGTMIVSAVDGGATTITWYVSAEAGSSAMPLNSGGSGVTTAIAGSNAYVLPDALFGAPFIVAVTDAGTATFRISVKG